jgi:PST family polysaccharide transporter
VPEPSRVDDDALSRTQLRDAALKGVRWLVLGRGVIELAALASSVIVARLVSPAEFGATAPAAFLLALGASLVAGSFASPLVQAKELRPEAVRTAFAMSLATGALLTLLVVIGAPALRLGFSSRTIELIQVVAPVFFIYSAGAVSQALIERDLDFRRASLNEVASLLPGTIATVVLAFAGLEGAAIVLGFLVQSLFSSGQAMFWRPPPLPAFDRRAARDILGFGLPSSGSSMLYTAQRNVGLGILGARLPAAQVGFYWRASTLAIDYQGKVSQILLRMMFPLLSRTQSRDDMRLVRSRMVKVHTSLLFPLLSCLIVIAPLFVPWLYGARWAPAATAAQILAVAGFTAVVGTGTGPLLMAAGRPGALVVCNGILLACEVVLLLFTAPHGLIATCVGIAALRVVSLVGTQYLLVDRLCGIPLRQTLFGDVLPAAGSCLALAAVAVPIRLALDQAGVPTLVTMVAACAGGLLAYALALRVGFRTTWADCMTLFVRLLPQRFARLAGGHAPVRV